MNKPSRAAADPVHQRLVDQYTQIASLAGGLAHEIKNPLSTIRLNMELLAEDFSVAQTPSERRALARIETVQEECLRLEHLLNDFLNFAKVRTPRLEPTDLNREVERVLQFFAARAAESKVEIVRFLDPDLPTVTLDREQFYGALVNLVINALEAMPEGGTLVARTHPSSAGVRLVLIDTGCGMSQQTREQIFDAFYSTKSGGSGLGLPTARKIIEAHGGRIEVESEVGKGTQFTIELPSLPRLARAEPRPALPR